jgi:hypothetical protein
MHSIILAVHILKESGGCHTTMMKRMKSEIVPAMGMTIEDAAFRGGSANPLSVTVSFERNEFYVALEPVTRPDEASAEAEVGAFRNHGWKKATELGLVGHTE